MNYSEMTVKELRALAAERGVTPEAPGNKAQLIAALEEADQAAEDATEAEEDATEAEEDATEAEEDATEAEEDAEKQTEPKEKSRYIAYVGPSIPGGLLTHGKILYGTTDSIQAYLATVLEKYPKVEELLVPMENMAQAMKDVKNPKKLLYHKAQEMTKRNGG